MIFAPKMSEIILEFESFELEPDPTPPAGVFCRYDRLEIWDGFPGGEQRAYIWVTEMKWKGSRYEANLLLIIANTIMATGKKKTQKEKSPGAVRSNASTAGHEALNSANKVTTEVSQCFSEAFATQGIDHKEDFLTRDWVRIRATPISSILSFKQKEKLIFYQGFYLKWLFWDRIKLRQPQIWIVQHRPSPIPDTHFNPHPPWGGTLFIFNICVN